jgi:hypothetical protein
MNLPTTTTTTSADYLVLANEMLAKADSVETGRGPQAIAYAQFLATKAQTLALMALVAAGRPVPLAQVVA